MASAIGLDIGSSAVRAVQLSGGRGPATLERLGQVLLPHGAVRDGEIVEPEQVAEALRILWQQYKFKGRKVAIGAANQQVVVRQIELPAMAPDQMRESLPFQVQDYIPIPVDEAQLDFEVLRTYAGPDGTEMARILLVAATTSMVNEILGVLSAAKLTPVALDLDAFALLRALVPPDQAASQDEGVGEMVVNVGGGVTNIVVHSQGVPRFVRILLMGGNNITEALANATGMSWDDAEALKATPTPPPGQEAQIIAERSERFISEIRGSLDYYRAQSEAVQVQRVVLTGGGAMLPGLPNRLAQVLRMPVDRGHPMQSLKIGDVPLSPEQLSEAEPFLSVAIGLALGVLEGSRP
ncbi:type IV pilus assembly protein PilM [Euzebya sp.]|uniref:type IV pilus assembly protein PilM n=1 Tax=Euzebya sp. TaxID=1971409 RepID=UPI003513F5B7